MDQHEKHSLDEINQEFKEIKERSTNKIKRELKKGISHYIENFNDANFGDGSLDITEQHLNLEM